MEVSMTRQKRLDEIKNRIHKPENYEKYQALLNGESRLNWHFKRAKKSLEELSNKASNAHDSLFESDFDVSIREMERILESEGWA